MVSLIRVSIGIIVFSIDFREMFIEFIGVSNLNASARVSTTNFITDIAIAIANHSTQIVSIVSFDEYN